MTVRVGINGFGRIGRNFYKAARLSGADLEVVAVNDLVPIETNAPLLKYDSTQATLHEEITVTPDGISVGGRQFRVFAERDPKEIPWSDVGADVVIESTGIFTSRAQAAEHLGGSVQRVIISGPSGDADATFVIGVNDDEFDPEMDVVISNASCTTNCFVPLSLIHI